MKLKNIYKNFMLDNKQLEYKCDGSLRQRVEFDYSLQLPLNFETVLYNNKIAVVAHIFYIDLCEEIKKYLSNIPGKVDLFISTDAESKKLDIERYFSDFNKGALDIRVFPNRGRDIAPTIICFKDVYCNYDVFLHIHSKKSLYNSDMNDWREYSYQTLLGTEETVKSILFLLQYGDIGFVFPQHFEKIRESIRWGANYKNTQQLLSRMNVNINKKNLLEFPSGSMFWARSKAIESILKLNLTLEEFQEENGQIDGTLAHAIERSFLYMAETAGFQWVKISSGKVLNSIQCHNKQELENALKQIYYSVLLKH